ncbi:MAG: TatD family hydrolase, partial [Candidatus Hydrothermarchaeota archaeon]
VVDCGATLATMERSLDLSTRYEGFVHSTLGLHPSSPFDPAVFEYIEKSIDKIVALGETGLDYHYARSDGERRAQLETFGKFVELAREYDLPLVIHSREAEGAVLEYLLERGVERAVFHCFSGPLEVAVRAVGAGYKISLATNICYSESHRLLVEEIGLEHLLLETDAPYLSPLRECRRNEPAFLVHSVAKVAEAKGVAKEEIARAVGRNARSFFGL